MKIIICTTFRDFNGTENDELQRMFLKSLEDQTYKDFELVITLFGEKNVRAEVAKFALKVLFVDSKVEPPHRYSLTKVVLNAIEYARANYEAFLILWTTCDVIYENNFLEVIMKNHKKNLIGTSHPHIVYSSLSEYFNNKGRGKKCLGNGFDLIYFDNHFVLGRDVFNALNNYVYNDWGGFEHFLIALNELSNNVSMINVYEESKIHKIQNDRRTLNESQEFFTNSWKVNSATLRKFLKENNITERYFDLVFCHLKFSLTRNELKHYLSFKDTLISYISKEIERRFLKWLK